MGGFRVVIVECRFERVVEDEKMKWEVGLGKVLGGKGIG